MSSKASLGVTTPLVQILRVNYPNWFVFRRGCRNFIVNSSDGSENSVGRICPKPKCVFLPTKNSPCLFQRSNSISSLPFCRLRIQIVIFINDFNIFGSSKSFSGNFSFALTDNLTVASLLVFNNLRLRPLMLGEINQVFFKSRNGRKLVLAPEILTEVTAAPGIETSNTLRKALPKV